MTRHRILRIGFICCLIALIVLFLPSSSVDSAPDANETIAVYPATPSFSQPFVVAVSGQWPNSCVPAFHDLRLAESSVYIEARTPGPLVTCTDGQANWGFSLFVPPSQPDFYMALLSVVSGITGETIASAREEFEVIGGIQIIPALPLTTEDVTVRLAGLSLDSCTPRYVSHDVITQTVTIEAQIPDLVCGQVPTPWQMDAAVDPMPAGEYRVEMFVTDNRISPPQRTRLLDGSFVVAETIYTTYFPWLGCFGSGMSPLVCNTAKSPAQRGVLP
jgi:hypothetical protein